MAGIVINTKSLHDLLEDVVDSNAFKSNIHSEMVGNAKINAELAAEDFIDILKNEINRLPGNYGSAISDWTYSVDTKIGDDLVLASVYPSCDTFRPSLAEATYGSVDLVPLFELGAKKGKKMSQVHGFWHGEEYWSRDTIEPFGYIQNAEDSFQSHWGDYNVIDVTDTIDRDK